MSLFGEQIIGDAPACGRVSRFLLGCLAIWNTEVQVAVRLLSLCVEAKGLWQFTQCQKIH